MQVSLQVCKLTLELVGWFFNFSVLPYAPTSVKFYTRCLSRLPLLSILPYTQLLQGLTEKQNSAD